jgi:membrane fusion protein, multidrug efflux system
MTWMAGAALLIACLTLGACDQGSAPPAEPTPVRAMAVQLRELDDTAALTGEIRARFESDLGFRVAGKVVDRPVDVGATVRKGDLLARLDDQDQQNSLKSAQADLAAAQAELAQTQTEEGRQSKLLASGYTTKVRYDLALKQYRTARAHVDAATANLKIAQDTVSYTELRADRDGIITAKGSEVGEVVAAGQMIVRLAQPGEKDAVFQVAGTRLHQAPQVRSAEIALVDDPAVVTEGHLREVSPGVDPVTRTYTIKVALPNAPDRMRLGATVIGRARLPSQPAAELPSSALFQTKDNAPAVWVVDRTTGTVGLRPVTVLRYETGKVIVTDGLAAGDLVVTGGVQKLRPGQKVIVKQAVT